MLYLTVSKMPLILQNLEDVTVELKRVWDELNLLRTKNLDISRRRVINASRSKNLNDYVIKEELNEVIESIPEAIVQTTIIERVSEEPPVVVTEFKRIYTKIILTEDTLVEFPDVLVTGYSHVYRIQQDGVGNHLLTWNSSFDSASLWPISRVADTYNIFEFIADSDDQKLYLNGFPVIGQIAP